MIGKGLLGPLPFEAVSSFSQLCLRYRVPQQLLGAVLNESAADVVVLAKTIVRALGARRTGRKMGVFVVVGR